jgi:hypothetical protein
MRIKRILFIGLILISMVRIGYALVITSPRNGEKYKEGETVKVVAEKTQGDPKFAFVYFTVTGSLDKCPDRIYTHPRYECSFIIPPGSPRAIEIGAVAVTAEQPVSSPDITIYVALPSSITLKELKSEIENRLFFSRLGQKRQIYIKGSYSDGVERDLRLGQTGTTYASSNENIIKIDADGLATAMAAGNAQVTVMNGDKKLVLDGVVKPKQ